MTLSVKHVWLALLVMAVALIAGGIDFHKSLYSYNDYRYLEIVLLASLPIIILFSRISVPDSRFVFFALVIFFGFGLFSALFSAYQIKSLTGYWLIINLVIAVVCFYRVNLSAFSIAAIASLIISCVLVYICVYYLDFVLDIIENKTTIKRNSMFHGFDNPRFLNHIQTLCIPLMIIAVKFISDNRTLSISFKKFIKTVFYFSTASYIALIFLTAGRGSIVSSLLAIFILWLILGKSFTYTGKQICLLWLTGLLIYFLQVTLYQSIVNVDSPAIAHDIQKFSGSGRVELWSVAIEQIRLNPVIGIGPLMFGNSAQAFLNSPHNSVLWLAAEWGLIASMSILSLLAYLLILFINRLRQATTYQNYDSKDPTLTLVIGQTLGLCLIGGSIHSLVSGIYIVPSSQLAALLVLILALSSYQNLANEMKLAAPISLQVNPGIKIFATLLLLLLLIPVYQYHKASEWGKYDMEDIHSEGDIIAPAYWLQGDR